MTGTKRLAANVIVDGVLYTPETDVPADVAKRIDNPKAWGEAPATNEKSSAANRATAKKAPSSKPE